MRVAFVGRQQTDFRVTGPLCWGIPEWGKPQLFRGMLGSEEHPPQPTAGAGRTPKPASPWQVSQSTFAVEEAADQVPFPAEAINQLLVATATTPCAYREGRKGKFDRELSLLNTSGCKIRSSCLNSKQVGQRQGSRKIGLLLSSL